MTVYFSLETVKVRREQHMFSLDKEFWVNSPFLSALEKILKEQRGNQDMLR